MLFLSEGRSALFPEPAAPRLGPRPEVLSDDLNQELPREGTRCWILESGDHCRGALLGPELGERLEGEDAQLALPSTT